MKWRKDIYGKKEGKRAGLTRLGCRSTDIYCQTPVLDLRLGVDFTFTLDNNDNDNHNNDNDNDKNPHLNFFKGTVLGVKVQELGIRDKR